MDLGEVLHRLVENSQAFTPDERVSAHEAITDGHGGDRHYLVPDPDDPDAGRQDPESADVDPRDQEIARLRRELASRDQPGGPSPSSGNGEPVTVADQRAAGVPADQTVTVADQRAGTPAPEPANGKHAAE